MKTIEEIKNEVAINNGFESWSEISLYEVFDYFDEVIKQCCDEQKIACAANAITMDDPKDNGKYEIGQVVDRESILSTPNVAEKQ